ncbi:Uncharacterized protein YjbI, contains pentapeptide repeats [Streptoalloteichus hindustanus]|uniref:Uncharacterized protein YjbI, contains pentapeptide repeats n=1 Tax=Streptoalloteichus hindustanus TaxID=2017 RepID=A0A1M5J2A6_STRHI|nr:Uncharacterized protein YjbI, contains pentapeptide repeats [Streptoalloteichus hindustanus]
MVVLPVLAITGIAITALVWTLDPSSPGERIDLVKTALSIGAGTGGVAALVLASRRQWSAEQAHRLAERTSQITEHDAAERRITELYTKAAEQLGSDKHTVRLAALYALERLAQHNPEHRQTTVNLLCGYLRTPYTPPRETPSNVNGTGVHRPLVSSKARRMRPAKSAGRSAAPTKPSHREAVLERDVRLTAQRILAAHLRPDYGDAGSPTNPKFWPEVLEINLTGAHLLDFNLDDCRVRSATFTEATFVGVARFSRMKFTRANFDRSSFSGETDFTYSTFTGPASFNKAIFAAEVRFDESTFTHDTLFEGAIFNNALSFYDATFMMQALFIEATFKGMAAFGDTLFLSGALFERANFTQLCYQNDSTFISNGSFKGAQLGNQAFDPTRNQW